MFSKTNIEYVVKFGEIKATKETDLTETETNTLGDALETEAINTDNKKSKATKETDLTETETNTLGDALETEAKNTDNKKPSKNVEIYIPNRPDGRSALGETPIVTAQSLSKTVDLSIISFITTLNLMKYLIIDLSWQLPILFSDERTFVIFNVSVIVALICLVVSIYTIILNCARTIMISYREIIEIVYMCGGTIRYISWQIEYAILKVIARSVIIGFVVSAILYISLLEIFRVLAPLSTTSYLIDCIFTLISAFLFTVILVLVVRYQVYRILNSQYY